MRTYHLSDLLIIKNGKDHQLLNDGQYPVYGSGGIMRYADQYLYDKPSILLPRKGTLSNIQFCDEPFWTVDTTYYTEVDETKVDIYYLYNYLRLLDLSNLNTGTGVPSMTFDSYYNIEVTLPELQIQHEISNSFKKVDSKISLNRRINSTLEAMAKQLYDYWFVQFDFPNEEGKPYKSSGGKMVWNEKLKREIPEGWEVNRLDKFVEVRRGGSPRPIDEYLSDSGFRWLKISDATSESSPFVYNIKEHIREEGLNKTVLMKAGELILSNSATPGLPKFLGVDTCIHDGWLYFPKSELPKEYMYLLFLQERKHLVKQGNGSIFVNLKTDILKGLIVFKPSDNVMLRFMESIGDLFGKINNTTQEISTLTSLRNFLLPLLMNGQVTIKDA